MAAFRRACTLTGALVCLLAVMAPDAAASDPFPRPSDAVCRSVSGLAFCDMVNYDAALAPSADTAAMDADAQAFHDSLNGILGKFDCTNRYSTHTCDDCRDAYKYWVCGMMFPQCGPGGMAEFCKPEEPCPVDAKAKRLCLSVCEDVVRKCPYTVTFKCPEESTTDYDGEVLHCNKLDRTVWPPGSEAAWPGTFSAAAPVPTALRVLLQSLAAVACVVVGTAALGAQA